METYFCHLDRWIEVYSILEQLPVGLLDETEVVAGDGDLLPLGPLLAGKVLGSGADEEPDVLAVPGAAGGAAPDGGSAVAAAGPVAALLAGAGAAAAGRVADLPQLHSSPTVTNYNKIIQTYLPNSREIDLPASTNR